MGARTPRDRAVADRFNRWRRWVRAAMAAVGVGLGAYLMVRPTLSLGVLALVIGAGFVVQGVLVLIHGSDDDDSEPGSWWGRVRATEAVLWFAAGLFVLLYLGLTVRLLAVVIAAGLIINGVRTVTDALDRTRSVGARITSGAHGAASIGFGLLAVLWPDITLLVAAVVFGARLVLSGILVGRRAIRGETTLAQPDGSSRSRRIANTTAALATVVLVIAAGAVSIVLRGASPVVDDFYAAPRVVPNTPGELLRSEPFIRGVPDNAAAWRILYTTTRGDGRPTVASGLVVVPKTGAGNWPVIDWNHGTIGVAQSCAPSLLDEPFTSGALYVLPEIIDQGWALVATDYIGLGAEGPHPYLVGRDAAYASLDAVRAAQRLEPAKLGRSTAVWGHSQGGGAALWTGALAHEYAPELKIRGVAALAPAANLPALLRNLPNVTGGSIFASFVVAGYTTTYSDVTWRAYIRPGAEATVRAMSQRCLAEPGVLASLLDVLGLSKDPDIFAKDPTTGPFGTRVEENVPPTTIAVPLLIAQGEADTLVIPAAQREYVDRARSAGEVIDYRTYRGRDHVPLVEADSPLVPELLSWTQDRFDGGG